MQEVEKITQGPGPDLSLRTADWVAKMNAFGAKRIPFLFILDFELKNPVVLPLSDLGTAPLKFNVGADSTEIKLTVQHINQPVEIYETGFNQVMNAIQAGDTYLLNLCYSTPISGITSLEEIFEKASAPYK